jgi:hypothetical protein
VKYLPQETFERKVSCTDRMTTEKGFENGKMKEKNAERIDIYRVHLKRNIWEVGLRWVNWLEISTIITVIKSHIRVQEYAHNFILHGNSYSRLQLDLSWLLTNRMLFQDADLPVFFFAGGMNSLVC